MKVVIAGGTGFVGRHIARALLDSGHSVTVLSRNPGKASIDAKLSGVEYAVGDVTEPSSLDKAMTGADAVIGVVQFPGYPAEVPRKGLTFDRYDRQGTEHLIAEAQRSGVSRFLYLSGAGADSRSERTWYRAKGRAEEAVRAGGFTWSIIRPSWAYGPEDRALNRFLQIARFSPIVPRIGVAPQYVQPIYVGDIGLTVSRLFERDDAWGGVIEIGGPQALTIDEVIRTMLEVAGLKRAVVPIPAPLAKIGVAPLLVLPRPPMTPAGIDFAVQDALVDTTEMTKTLDIEPIPLREGLSRYLRY